MQSELSAEEDAILVQMTRMRLQNLGKGPSAAKVSAGKRKAEVLHFTLDNSTKDDEQLLKNTNASHLKISCARPEEDRLQALLLLPKIEALTLEHVREQHVVERLLASFGPDLLALSIRYVSVSSDCLPVRRLIRSCPKLEKLSLEGISLLEQENAACLPELRKFKWTNSEWCKEVGQVLRSPKLQKVVLEGAVHVDVLTQATELIRQRAILRQLRALHVHQTHAFGRFSARFLASQFEAGALLAKTAAAFLPQLTDVQFSLKECLFSNFPFSPSVGIRHDQNLDKILKEFKKFNRSK